MGFWVSPKSDENKGEKRYASDWRNCDEEIQHGINPTLIETRCNYEVQPC